MVHFEKLMFGICLCSAFALNSFFKFQFPRNFQFLSILNREFCRVHVFTISGIHTQILIFLEFSWMSLFLEYFLKNFAAKYSTLDVQSYPQRTRLQAVYSVVSLKVMVSCLVIVYLFFFLAKSIRLPLKGYIYGKYRIDTSSSQTQV